MLLEFLEVEGLIEVIHIAAVLNLRDIGLQILKVLVDFLLNGFFRGEVLEGCFNYQSKFRTRV